LIKIGNDFLKYLHDLNNIFVHYNSINATRDSSRVQISFSRRLSSGYKLNKLGKSSLLCQFVDGVFDDKLLSTIGVDFKFRRVKIGK